MRNWPPSWEELRETAPGSAVSRYAQRLRSDLTFRAPYFLDLAQNDQQELVNMILLLDSYAGGAASRLRDSPFTEEQRRFFTPPVGAGRGRKLKEWKRHYQDQACIDAARRARIAIFDGDWIRAVGNALAAGNYAIGNLAAVARPIVERLPKKGTTKPRSETLVERDHVICDEAADIRAQNPAFADNDSWVADRIARHHKHEPRFPKAERIRKILAQARNLGTQGLSSHQ